jgi:enoyl-CoA hydratase/carnithine racemase
MSTVDRDSADGEEPIQVVIRGDVAVIRLNKPPHNLVTAPLMAGLAETLAGLADQVRSAVICGSGKSFCAGADFRSSEAPDPTDSATFEQRTSAFYQQAARIFESPVPLVAAVHGAAVGAGFGLALACDYVVVGTRAAFKANFVNLGIHPGFALSLTIPRAVGPARAADILLTGRTIGAEEAVRIGLAQQLVEEGNELDGALEVANAIASAAPFAVASTRSTLRRGLAAEARSAMALELAEQTALAGSPDVVEGVTAMLEGRKPVFGR